MFKIRIEDYATYGLNRYRSLFSEVRSNKIEFEDPDDVYLFAQGVLDACSCRNSAVFMIHFDNSMSAAVINPEEETMDVYGIEDLNLDYFASIDADLRLCCYGLMIETLPGEWKLIK